MSAIKQDVKFILDIPKDDKDLAGEIGYKQTQKDLWEGIAVQDTLIAIIKLDTVNNDFKLFISQLFEDTYKGNVLYKIVSAFATKVQEFYRATLGRLIHQTNINYHWSTLFNQQILTPLDTFFTIYDLKFFYFSTDTKDIDLKKHYSTNLPEPLINYDVDINKRYNDFGETNENFILNRKLKYLKARIKYNDIINEKIYTFFDLDQKEKDYLDYRKKLKKDEIEPNDLLTLAYLKERPLHVDEICNYFQVDLDSVVKLYYYSYNNNAFRIIYDFYENIDPSVFTKYIIDNIQNVTKFLFTDYCSYINRDRVFLALFCIMTCVSKTGLFLLMNFLKDTNIIKTNDILLNDIDYDRLNFWGLNYVNTFYAQKEDDKVFNQIKIIDTHVKPKEIKNFNSQKIDEKPISKKIYPYKKLVINEKKYDSITQELKLNETYILDVEKEKALLKIENERMKALESVGAKIRLTWKESINNYVDSIAGMF